MPSGPLVTWMNPLPFELTAALRARRASLAAAARGRVLDLGGWTDHLDSYGEVDVDLLVAPGQRDDGDERSRIRRLDAGIETLIDLDVEPYDTTVSLIRMPLVEDLPRFLAALLRLTADDGHLLFLEPVRRSDLVGRALAAWGPLVRATAGLHLDRDVVTAVREAGFFVTDLHRFHVPSVSAPLRPFVAGQARVTLPRSSPS